MSQLPDDEAASRYSDEPVDASADELQRSEYATRIALAIDQYRKTDASTVAALVGPWGSGKTSVIKMMTSELEGAGHWTVQAFNPWFYADEASLQLGFFRTIEDAFNLAGLKAKRVRRAIGGFAQTIAPAGAAVPVVGSVVQASVGAAGGLLAGAPTAEQAVKRLEKILRSDRRRRSVLIVMDDLDRLAPDELLLLFKLVRLVGRLPHVHYLLAYDEDTLLDVLSRTGLVGDHDPRRGTDYVEKMVQIRFEIPPLRETQVTRLVNEALASMASKVGLQLDQSDSSRFSAFYFSTLAARLRTPRALKRWVAQCEAMWEQLTAEIDPVDYLIVTWLRTMEPLLYGHLHERKDDLVGVVRRLSFSQVKPADLQQGWKDLFSLAKVTDIDGAAEALGELFPRFREIWSLQTQFSSGQRPPRRISNPDYFDRYFAFEVPVEDISDQLVASAVQAIRLAEASVDLDSLTARFPDTATVVLPKMLDLVTRDPSSEAACRVIEWLGNNFHTLPPEMDLITTRGQVRGTITNLLAIVDSSELVNVIESLVDVEDGLDLATDVLRYHVNRNLGSTENRDAEAAVQDATERLRNVFQARLDKSGDAPASSIPESDWDAVWRWLSLDISTLAEYFSERFKSGAWTRLEVAVRLISTSIALGVPNPPARLSDLDPMTLNNLVGLAALADEVGVNAVDAEPPFVGDRPLDTPENRLAIVMGVLHRTIAGRPRSEWPEPPTRDQSASQ